MYKKSLYLLPVLLIGTNPAQAQTCSPAPSCAELGYTKTSANCSGKSLIKCPFDQSKVFCEDGASCASLGFTDTLSECPGEYTICPNDSTKGKCIMEARAGDLKYSLKTANHNGWLLCNGAFYSSATYPELHSAIGHLFGNLYASYLPNYSGYFLKGAATSDGSALKTPEKAGLPNIYGTFAIVGKNANNMNLSDSSGSFKFDNWGNAGYDSGKFDLWQGRAVFDASTYNSIYGSSYTVTPQNYSANIFIYSGRRK